MISFVVDTRSSDDYVLLQWLFSSKIFLFLIFCDCVVSWPLPLRIYWTSGLFESTCMNSTSSVVNPHLWHERISTSFPSSTVTLPFTERHRSYTHPPCSPRFCSLPVPLCRSGSVQERQYSRRLFCVGITSRWHP